MSDTLNIYHFYQLYLNKGGRNYILDLWHKTMPWDHFAYSLLQSWNQPFFPGAIAFCHILPNMFPNPESSKAFQYQ